jgi:hypothetical protein
MCRRYRFLFISILLLGQSTAVTAMGKPCWVDFYEYAQYLGAHVRLHGPLSLSNLKDVDGQNWDSRIDSLKVGPKAKVIIFEHPAYKLTLTEMAKHPVLMKSLGITEEDIKLESELIFGANEKSHHLGEFNFHQKTRSIKIECL